MSYIYDDEFSRMYDLLEDEPGMTDEERFEIADIWAHQQENDPD